MKPDAATESLLPRIFVGTLYSGEAELEECRAAVAAQRDVVVEHHVISNLPEHEAHATLWEAWNSVKGQFDLFAKIDADTVLRDETVLSTVQALFAADKDVTGAQVLLHDYFTDQLIAGLNFFSPEVVFQKTKNRLYCDRVDTNHKKVLNGDAVAHLAPIGYHCNNPKAVQAFHFGLHRMFKKQDDLVRRVAQVYLEKGGEGRMWALGGAMSASFWLRNHSDYGDRKFRKAFYSLSSDMAHESKIYAFAKKQASHD